MNTATTTPANFDLTTISGLNAMLDATQGERPAIETATAAPAVKLTDAQRLALVDAVTPKTTQGLMTWERGELSFRGAGVKSVCGALIDKGLAVRITDARGDSYCQLTPAGLVEADALAAVFTLVAPSMANKFRGALAAK